MEGAREICEVQQMEERCKWEQGRGTENSGYCKKKKIFGTKLTKVVGDLHLPLNSDVKEVSWCLTLVAPLFLWS